MPSKKIIPPEIVWKLHHNAVKDISPIRDELGEEKYSIDKEALQEYLCRYFSSDSGCQREQGGAISPLGCPTDPGWKCLKVRWAIPGRGSSSGFRMAVAVHCENKCVNILRAWIRKKDPSKEEFEEAFAEPNC